MRNTLMPGEDTDLFRQFFEGFEQVFQPANTVELALVEEIVNAKWRLRRTWGTENTVYQITLLRNQAAVEREFENAGPDIHYAAAFEHLANNTRTLAQLHRDETRLARLHDRALNQILTLQEMRRQSEKATATDTLKNPTPEPPPNALIPKDHCPPEANLQNNPNPAGTSPQPGVRESESAPIGVPSRPATTVSPQEERADTPENPAPDLAPRPLISKEPGAPNEILQNKPNPREISPHQGVPENESTSHRAEPRPINLTAQGEEK